MCQEKLLLGAAAAATIMLTIYNSNIGAAIRSILNISGVGVMSAAAIKIKSVI